MLHYAISFMNQHSKYFDQLCYNQVKNFQQSIQEMEKEYKSKFTEMEEQISQLNKEKDSKWRNIFMVVKDNRVLRRQKTKLQKLHTE